MLALLPGMNTRYTTTGFAHDDSAEGDHAEVAVLVVARRQYGPTATVAWRGSGLRGDIAEYEAVLDGVVVGTATVRVER